MATLSSSVFFLQKNTPARIIASAECRRESADARERRNAVLPVLFACTRHTVIVKVIIVIIICTEFWQARRTCTEAAPPPQMMNSRSRASVPPMSFVRG